MNKMHIVLAAILTGIALAAPGESRAQDRSHTANRSANPTPPQAREAPTGLDNRTNGYLVQGPEYSLLNDDTVEPLRSFNDNRFIFEETETDEDGLGPVYNARGCLECHQNGAAGGASQVAEHRSGSNRRGRFAEAAGGSLIHSRAIHPDLIEQVSPSDNVNTLRVSTSTLGDGYVEAIADETLLAIRDGQPAEMRGTAIRVPVLETNGVLRLGRFGWKNQHASLESFAADAYLNEMGITSPLFPQENTSSGRSVAAYDRVADPEDDGVDIVAFADFIRATTAPSRGPVTSAARFGERVFSDIGCNVCHTPSITTSSDAPMRDEAYNDPGALTNRTIHAYSDFLLHDVGTGDGVPTHPGPEYAQTANQIRTAPLWGLRTRNRLMHDGLSYSAADAIRRHGGQAATVRDRYDALDRDRRSALMAFLASL
jgi:CxxC motif-containing protein (DUF1111 family)